MKRWMIALVISGLVMSGTAIADEITIGTGTSTWSFPLYTNYHDARTQTIYLASEIGTPCTISSLSLYVTTVPGQTMNNFTIRMKHTDLAAYGSSPVWESTGWTTVYQANQTISTTGWVQFNFSTPFVYNGNQNLMVDISFNNSSWTSAGNCRYSTPGGTRSIYYRTDSGYGDPLTWPSRTPIPTSSSYVPNLKLGVTSATTVMIPAFSPAAGTYNSEQSVVVTCSTTGATIHYTTNGVDPNENDPIIASGGSVLVDRSLTLKAMAWKDGLTPSAIRTDNYVLQVAAPVFDPNGGNYMTAPTVTVTCSTPGATTHYTTSGIDPTENDPVVASGGTIVVSIDTPTTLKARSFKGLMTPSAITSRTYRMASVIHVRPGGNDTADGLSWTTAKATLKAGLDIAAAGDEIWVAAGTYKPADRTQSFRMKNGVGMYAGFAGNETKREQRAPQVNVTILSGEVGDQTNLYDNCWHVIYNPPVTASDPAYTIPPVLDGFVLTSGYSLDSPTNSGSALHNSHGPIIVTGCTIRNNLGTAVYCGSSSITFNGCTFASNSAGSPNYGGAMFVASSSLTLTNCIFACNFAYSGAAVTVWDSSSVTLTGCTFSGNKATLGSAVTNQSGTCVARNCIFWDVIPTNGSEIYGSATVTYSDIQGGKTGTGNISGNPTLVRNAGPGADGIVSTADDDWGDLRLSMGSPCIDAGSNAYVSTSVDIAGNPRMLDGNGDGTATVDMGAYESPRAASQSGTEFTASFIVVARRRVSRTVFDYDCKVALTNNLTQSIRPIQFQLQSVPANMSILDASVSSFADAVPGGGVVSADTCTFRVDRSLLVNASQVKWLATYQLLSGGQSVQVMAASMLALEQPVVGDVNGDGLVDSADLAAMTEQWLTARASGDGVVDFADFAAIASQWSESPASE